ncbi:MAG: TonB-dependent receptor [Steroidobacteraceae bacterium]
MKNTHSVAAGTVAVSVRRILALTMMAAGMASLTAQAIAAEQDDALEEVIITGSSIKRAQAEGALPVQVFGQEEIRRSGTTSVMDFVQQIPAMQGFEPISDSVGGSGGGVSTASLHDVGSQYTLVLLNGHRVAPSDSGTTIDLNTIPLAAVERVEVLTDGASALYGADAIAGVVNFKLKRGEAPLTVDVRRSEPQHGGGDSLNLSLTKGFGNLNADGYETFFALSYDKLKRLKASQRDFARSGIIQGRQGDIIYDFFNGSTRSVPPNVDLYDLDAPPDEWPLTSFSPYYEANGRCPVDHVADSGQCVFDYTTTVEIAPEIERKSAYGTARVRLGDSSWSAFADVAAVNADTITGIAPYPAEFAMETTHPYYTRYILPYITPAEAAAVDLVNVKYRLYDMGDRETDYATDTFHVVAGLEGKAAGWDLSAALTYSMQKQKQIYTKGWPLADAFDAGMQNQLFDPFPYAAGQMPQAQIDALRATQYVGVYDSNKMLMQGIEANAQRELFNLPGGAFIASIGGDFRDTSYKKTLSNVAANGLILFDTPQDPFDLSRTNWGVYGELLAPLLPKLELTGAVRYDSIAGIKDGLTHSTVGDTESQTTYKLGLKWSLTDSLALRGSYGTGFRVATMREIAQPIVDFGVTGDTYTCPFNAGYDPLGYIASGYVCASGLQFEVKQGGNADLKPETSRQWNVGFIWSPSRDFSMGANYWSVEIKNAVDSVSEALIFNNPARYLDLFTTKYVASSGLTYVAMLDSPINIGRQQREGIDWDFKVGGDVGIGRLTGALAGTYMIKSSYTVPGTADEWTSSLGEYGVDNKVSFRHLITLNLALKTGPVENSVQVRYRSGYKDVPFSASDYTLYDPSGNPIDGRLNVPSYSLINWRTVWSVNDVVDLTFGIDNLVDKKPPLTLRTEGSHQLGYDPRYADAYLRTFTLGFTARF